MWLFDLEGDGGYEVGGYELKDYFELLVNCLSRSQIASAVICVYISEADRLPLGDISLCRG